MARRDELTYDLNQQTRRQVPWTSVALLVAVIAVAGLLLGWTVVSNRAPETRPAAQSTPLSTSAAATPSTSPSPSSASPLPSGSDAEEGLSVPEGSQQVATLFVRAWLDVNAKTRKPALDRVASPALAEQLMLTDPANIPRTRPRGAPTLDESSTYSAQFTQSLSSGMKIQIYLVADPAARYGWMATSVDQA